MQYRLAFRLLRACIGTYLKRKSKVGFKGKNPELWTSTVLPKGKPKPVWMGLIIWSATSFGNTEIYTLGIRLAMWTSSDLNLSVFFSIYWNLYNNPRYSRILIGSRPWSIRGQTHRWRKRSIQFFLIFWILNLNQSQFFTKHRNQSVRFILYRHYITSVLFSCLSEWRNLK